MTVQKKSEWTWQPSTIAGTWLLYEWTSEYERPGRCIAWYDPLWDYHQFWNQAEEKWGSPILGLPKGTRKPPELKAEPIGPPRLGKRVLEL